MREFDPYNVFGAYIQHSKQHSFCFVEVGILPLIRIVWHYAVTNICGFGLTWVGTTEALYQVAGVRRRLSGHVSAPDGHQDVRRWAHRLKIEYYSGPVAI